MKTLLIIMLLVLAIQCEAQDKSWVQKPYASVKWLGEYNRFIRKVEIDVTVYLSKGMDTLITSIPIFNGQFSRKFLIRHVLMWYPDDKFMETVYGKSGMMLELMDLSDGERVRVWVGETKLIVFE